MAKLLDAAEAVGGQVLSATRVLAEGFSREAAVVEAIGCCQVRSSGSSGAWVLNAHLIGCAGWPAIGGCIAAAVLQACRSPNRRPTDLPPQLQPALRPAGRHQPCVLACLPALPPHLA